MSLSHHALRWKVHQVINGHDIRNDNRVSHVVVYCYLCSLFPGLIFFSFCRHSRIIKILTKKQKTKTKDKPKETQNKPQHFLFLQNFFMFF